MVLFVDCSDITFDVCEIDNSYSQQFQIWNRSELALQCKISLLTSSWCSPNIQFQDVDATEVLALSETLLVRPYIAKRIQVIFHAQELGECSCSYRIEDIADPTNFINLNCLVAVSPKIFYLLAFNLLSYHYCFEEIVLFSCH